MSKKGSILLGLVELEGRKEGIELCSKLLQFQSLSFSTSMRNCCPILSYFQPDGVSVVVTTSPYLAFKKKKKKRNYAEKKTKHNNSLNENY